MHYVTFHHSYRVCVFVFIFQLQVSSFSASLDQLTDKLAKLFQGFFIIIIVFAK